MPGNPHADAAQPIYSSHQTHEQVQESLVYTQREATLALAYEVRTVALLLASTMAGTADSADDQYETAMQRMGETDEGKRSDRPL